MKKKLVTKFVSIAMAALMMASLTTACGGKSEAPATTSAPAAETKTDTKADIPAPAAETKTEPESKAAPEDDSASEVFTLLDVTTDMIKTGVYATGDDGIELVFSMFTMPSGEEMASLFVLGSDGSGDVLCGPYTGESETDEDGIAWSKLTVSDVYTESDYTFGFGELGDEVYLLTTEAAYEGQYLTADETIVYMGTAAALMEGGTASGDAADNSDVGEFTLLDVTTDMIEAGVYATDDEGIELVFSMFTVPSGEKMASLFILGSDGSGEVLCGTYAGESETDEDGITWSVLTVSDVYSGDDFTFGFGELGDEVYLLDRAGNAYEGKYLTADETIVYMGTAAALME